MKINFILLVAVFAISCNPKKNSNNNIQIENDIVSKTSENYFNAIFDRDSEDGVIRGFAFGVLQKDIEATENDLIDLIESNEQLSFYEILLSNDTTKNIDYAEIKYFYNSENKLDIATINYYVEDSLVNMLLFENISKAYEKRFGHSYVDVDGYNVWTSENSSASGFDIALKMKQLLNLNEPGITLEYTKF